MLVRGILFTYNLASAEGQTALTDADMSDQLKTRGVLHRIVRVPKILPSDWPPFRKSQQK
jgi:hypothetical protein